MRHNDFNYRSALINDLSLEIVSNEIPKISCAFHKNNIAFRMAIETIIIKKLSKYASKHKNSINQSKFYMEKKARLRIENKTSWSSSFLMLDSFHTALKRDAIPCHVL